MEEGKRKFISEVLIPTAQQSIWKNQLAKEYNAKFASEGNDKITKDKACDEALKKDAEYMEFLNAQLSDSQ